MADRTITLTALDERALAAATALYNARPDNEALTVDQYFQKQARSFLDHLVNVYRDGVKGKIARTFDTLTPAQQQALLDQLGISD